MIPRRRFLAAGALGAACACAAGWALAQPAAPTPPGSPSGKWVCPPCGCDADGKTFDASGVCPADGCGMTLTPKPSEDSPKTP